MSAAIRVGDLITARPVQNGYGTRGDWRGIVTHVGEYDGKPSYSGVGISDGDVTHLSSYVGDGDVELADPGEGDLARAYLAGLYARPGMSDRNRARLLEIAQLVAFRRIAAVRPGTDGTMTISQHHGEAFDQIQHIIHSDSGPASTELRANRKENRA